MSIDIPAHLAAGHNSRLRSGARSTLHQRTGEGEAGARLDQSERPSLKHRSSEANLLLFFRPKAEARAIPLGAPAAPEALTLQKHHANHGFDCTQVVALGRSFDACTDGTDQGQKRDLLRPTKGARAPARGGCPRAELGP